MIRRLAILAVLGCAGAALACLWDSDTFAEEALTQKDVGEIVRGRLGKHSPYFYEEKVAYTRPLLDAGDAGVERYDDLAVAYEKLGKLDEALVVMDAKEKRFPHQYTTLANRGTFYAHQGDYPRALELLEAAIVMNPNAHFGREKYQVKALEFMQALAKDPKLAEHRDLLGVNLDDEEKLMFGDTGKKKKGSRPRSTRRGSPGTCSSRWRGSSATAAARRARMSGSAWASRPPSTAIATSPSVPSSARRSWVTPRACAWPSAWR